jgi:DNA repair protein RadA/Sms
VLAILERRADVALGSFDVYVSIAGGIRVAEPAVDLPLALALASARRERALPHDAVAFGELGLTGGVRAVPHAAARMREASRMGFGQVFGPSAKAGWPDGITYTGAETIGAALEVAFG